MEPWLRVCCLLCVYGFLREMRPSDPYFIEFVTGEIDKNITQSELNRSVLPVITYSYMAQLVIILMVTDYFRYKPIILFTSFIGIIVWAMILWTTSLLALEIAHVFYGTFLAGEIAYYTYIYAKVDKINFAKATAYARAAMLAGKCVACLLAQVSINMNMLTYRNLHEITLVAEVLATLWACRLPRARKSLYFHRHYSVVDSLYPLPEISKDDEEIAERISNFSESEFQQVTAAHLLWIHVSGAYTTKTILVWSIFYACSYCGYLQVQSYVQVLWKEIDPSTVAPWNAGVEGMFRLLGTLAAFAAGYIESVDCNPRAYVVFAALLTAIQGVVVLITSVTDVIMVSYVGYVLYGLLYNFIITIASTEVAKELESESYALIFGINTFLALLISTIFTLLVVSDYGYALDVFDQYVVFSIFLIVVGCAYALFEAIDFLLSLRRR